MLQLNSYLTPATLLCGGLLLGACGGGNPSTVGTNTPSSTMGTGSATTKVGGVAPDTLGVGPAPTGASTSAPSTGQQPK